MQRCVSQSVCLWLPRLCRGVFFNENHQLCQGSNENGSFTALMGFKLGSEVLGVRGPIPFPPLVMSTLLAPECHGGKAGEPGGPAPPGLLRRCGRRRVGLAYPPATSGFTCCCHLLEPPSAPAHLISYPQTGRHLLALTHLLQDALASFGLLALPCPLSPVQHVWIVCTSAFSGTTRFSSAAR